VANRDSAPAAVRATAAASETAGSETPDPIKLGEPATVPHADPLPYPLMAIHPAGGQPLCWCGRCLGRRGHYAV
jgi:hypothetical protein